MSWTPDSKAIIVAQDEGGNERYQLSRIDIERPLQMAPLTDTNPNYFLRGGDLHANGRWLVYGANFDSASGREIEPTWIYRHDLESGERKVLARPQKAAYLQPRLSPDGRFVLYTRSDLHPAGKQVWLVDIDGRQDREIINLGDAVKTSALWFPDGERILVLSETKTHRRFGIWTMAGSIQCLDRRLPDEMTLATEIIAWEEPRNAAQMANPFKWRHYHSEYESVTRTTLPV